ncbi:MAG: hypothetical protein HFE48_04285 [Clostridia bacterium]|nr:hypothetical protein [Clostridia bacterium]
MKKKTIFAVALSLIMLISMLSLAACKDEVVYYSGEYGQIDADSENSVIPNAVSLFGLKRTCQKSKMEITVY